MKIHQFVHTLNYGDAISGEALAIERLLRAEGIESSIYSLHTHEKLEGKARSWKHFARDIERDKLESSELALILHHSISSPLNQIYAEASEFARVMIYHNLTPEKWFACYNNRVLEDLIRGREELPKLVGQSDLLIADSTYNAKELQALGATDTQTLPLLFDSSKWQVAANRGISRILTGQRGANILHVGRLAPNKCIEDVIKGFYFYHHKIDPESRLWLVGIDIDTEIYEFELRRLVSRLSLKEAVNFVGGVADSELKAFYENSDLYLCMSEHEGFCLPLVEAMYFELPIIAYDSSAIAETLGNAGVLIPDKSPAELAELMHIVIADKAVRQHMLSNGQKQSERFSVQQFQLAFNQTLLNPLRRLFASNADTAQAANKQESDGVSERIAHISHG